MILLLSLHSMVLISWYQIKKKKKIYIYIYNKVVFFLEEINGVVNEVRKML